MRYLIFSGVLVFGLMCLFLGTDWFKKPLSSEQIYQAAQECRKAELQVYVIARSFQGEAIGTGCRGFD